jgi:hypothetical protein
MHLFKSAGSLAPPTEPAAAVFKFRLSASIFVVATSPATFSLANTSL